MLLSYYGTPTFINLCLFVCTCGRGLQLRREKIDLENTLEQEQEMLVNKLWKRMDKVRGLM